MSERSRIVGGRDDESLAREGHLFDLEDLAPVCDLDFVLLDTVGAVAQLRAEGQPPPPHY